MGDADTLQQMQQWMFQGAHIAIAAARDAVRLGVHPQRGVQSVQTVVVMRRIGFLGEEWTGAWPSVWYASQSARVRIRFGIRV